MTVRKFHALHPDQKLNQNLRSKVPRTLGLSSSIDGIVVVSCFLSVTILLILLINFLSDGKVETVFIIESNAALEMKCHTFASGHLKPAQNLPFIFINGVMMVKSFTRDSS
jgi:hypothetical protein